MGKLAKSRQIKTDDWSQHAQSKVRLENKWWRTQGASVLDSITWDSVEKNTSIVPDDSNLEPIQSSAGREFKEQKRLFLGIPKSDLEQYRGEFVASRDGKIVAHDPDLANVTNQFFSEHGDVAVYITRIGGPIRVTLRTPSRR